MKTYQPDNFNSKNYPVSHSALSVIKASQLKYPQNLTGDETYLELVADYTSGKCYAIADILPLNPEGNGVHVTAKDYFVVVVEIPDDEHPAPSEITNRIIA